MIIGFFIKHWKKLFDVLIIAVIVVGFVLWNPGNFFGGGLKLQHTANHVSSIREIGQLITAEYYGEAIATLDQSRLRLSHTDTLAGQANDTYRAIKQDLFVYYGKQVENFSEKKKEKFWSFKWLAKALKISDQNKNLENVISENTKNDPLYVNVLEFLYPTLNKGNKSPKDFNNKTKEQVLNQLLDQMINVIELDSTLLLDSCLNADLPDFNQQVFTDFYHDKQREALSKKEEKKELAIIGRGWVKAGFDFGTLNERNFQYDEQTGIVHVFGLHPKILNADINPWFIPEEKIPGFQILEANRHVGFEDVKLVKKYCIEKLELMALEAGILERAEAEGKIAIQNFVHLLTETEVKDVHFHYDALTEMIQQITEDEFINAREGILLDTLIAKQIQEVYTLQGNTRNYSKSQKLAQIKINQLRGNIKALQSCHFLRKNHHYGRLGTTVYRIAADSILTTDELTELWIKRWTLENIFRLTDSFPKNKKDSLISIEQHIWYATPWETIHDFDTSLTLIKQVVKQTGTIESQTLKTDEINTLNDFYILSSVAQKDSLQVFFLDPLENPDTLLSLHYPFNLPSNWQNNLRKRESLFKINNGTDTCLTQTLNWGTDSAKLDTELCLTQITTDSLKSILATSNFKLQPEDSVMLAEMIQVYEEEHKIRPFSRMNEGLKKHLNPELRKEKAVAMRKWFQKFQP